MTPQSRYNTMRDRNIRMAEHVPMDENESWLKTISGVLFLVAVVAAGYVVLS